MKNDPLKNIRPKISRWHWSNIVGSIRNYFRKFKFQHIITICCKTQVSNNNTIYHHYYRLYLNGFGKRKCIIDTNFSKKIAREHPIYLQYIKGWIRHEFDNDKMKQLKNVLDKQLAREK